MCESLVHRGHQILKCLGPAPPDPHCSDHLPGFPMRNPGYRPEIRSILKMAWTISVPHCMKKDNIVSSMSNIKEYTYN